MMWNTEKVQREDLHKKCETFFIRTIIPLSLDNFSEIDSNTTYSTSRTCIHTIVITAFQEYLFGFCIISLLQ